MFVGASAFLSPQLVVNNTKIIVCQLEKNIKMG